MRRNIGRNFVSDAIASFDRIFAYSQKPFDDSLAVVQGKSLGFSAQMHQIDAQKERAKKAETYITKAKVTPEDI